MKIRGMGICAFINESTSNPERLKLKLHRAAELGLDTVELPIQGMNLLRNGQIDRDRLHMYQQLLRNVPLKYTTHAPFDLNLFRQGDYSTDAECLMASVEISGALGAELMVYHVGRFVGEEQFMFSHTWAKLTDIDKRALMVREQEWMRRAGDLGRETGVLIGMENMRPYLDCEDYAYSVSPSALAEQLEAIDHPQVGAVLDTGHLNLAVTMYGLDLIREMERLAPHIIHMHLHDNFGKACFSTEKSQYELIPLGRGDMHAPIGDGNVPFHLIAECLASTFDGHIIHEVREMYEPFWPELRERYANALIPGSEQMMAVK